MCRESFCFFFMLVCPLGCYGAIEQFVESFRGTGQFSSENVKIAGFDNPGWKIEGDPYFKDGGLQLENFGLISATPDQTEGDILYRRIAGTGDFVETIQITGLELFDPADQLVSGRASFSLAHFLDVEDARNRLFVGASVAPFPSDTESTWSVTFSYGEDDFLRTEMELGPDLLFEIHFVDSEVVFRVDNNISDNIAAIQVGPFPYRREIDDLQISELVVSSVSGVMANGKLEHWSLLRDPDVPPGDFDEDGIVDVDDIDLLDAEIKNGTNNPVFDLQVDGVVDVFDRNVWVDRFAKTWFGDSNLDGEFNSSDLVSVFVAGEYEDDIELNSTWAEGDWDGNGEFNSRDLVFAFQDDGYEVGPRVAVGNVPEPTTSFNLLVVICLLGFAIASRRAHS